MTDDAILAALDSGGWLKQPPDEHGENRMFCPICEDPDTSASPSASYNAAERRWNCLKSEHSTSLATLTAALGLNTPKQTTSRRAPRARPPRQDRPTPLQDQSKPAAWHDRLMLGERADFLKFLTSERGLSAETLQRFSIGTDGKKVTIPVRVRAQWVNVRYYLPHAPTGKAKMTNLRGHGEIRLYLTELLENNSLPVLLCEGELDALLANQHAQGRYVALSGTGGADNPPLDLRRLASREVFIAYDCDDAGRAGAEKVARLLREMRT